MNTSPRDDSTANAFKDFEVTHRRPLRWFQWFVWGMVIFMFAEGYFLPHDLPRSIKMIIILGSMVVLLSGVLGFLWWLVPKHPLVKQMRPAARRLGRRAAYALLLYLALLAAAQWYYRALHPAGIAAVLAGLAPGVPLLFAIRALLLFLKEETDEFLRARLLESWAIATALTLGVCTLWGFLDQFEVVPHLPLWAAFPIWVCALVPANLLLQRRDA